MLVSEPKKPSPKTTLHDRGLTPKKSFGQNFMMDQHVNAIFATAASSLGKGATLIEIGAGTGSLTRHLLEVAPVVHAVERDRDLAPILREDFKDPIAKGHLVIHEADGARFDVTSVVSKENPGVLVGNLPYHLTSSVMLLTLHHRNVLKGGVFLVQKEVADRLAAHHNSKDYGFLTVVLGLAFTISKVTQVDKSAFWPVPKIDSTIIKLAKRDQSLIQTINIDRFIVFVREIFQKRRKKLSTILSGTLSKTEITEAGINPDDRPENLTPELFLALFLATKSDA
jgi:16S rRNA (adenine1518-N6/adenine1519-N6)-dimethyltransferase